MPDGSISGGPYTVPPSPDDERIRVPIEKGLPEEIPGLAWGKPDFKGLEHKIVRTFGVDRKKRPELDCVPCAICSGSHPKFLEGAVLWSSDGSLRIIGHKCAANPEHFGVVQYRALQEQREQEQLDSVAFNWLHANLAFFELLRAELMRLKQFALFFEAQQKVFFHNLPDLAAILENAVRRDDGVLTVTQELSGSRLVAAEVKGRARGAAQSQYETVGVGAVRGVSFVKRPKIKRSRQFEGCKEALDMIPVGTGDEPMLALIDQGGEGQITITAGAIFRAIQRALKLAEECAEAEMFVGVENLATLENWGRDARNTMGFTVHRLASQVQFILTDRSRGTLSTEWPKLPDLSSFKLIVAAGIELDGLLP